MYNKQLTAGLTIITLLLSQVSAHFILQYPKSLGFDDDKEGDAPCGGFDVTTNNASDFHVDGDAVALTSTHPQANWLFRATLDKTAAGNWTDLLPAVSESGLGAFCEPALTVPSSWAGSSGIVQVIQHGDDGELYQVRFSLEFFMISEQKNIFANSRVPTVCCAQLCSWQSIFNSIGVQKRHWSHSIFHQRCQPRRDGSCNSYVFRCDGLGRYARKIVLSFEIERSFGASVCFRELDYVVSVGRIWPSSCSNGNCMRIEAGFELNRRNLH